MSDNYLSSIPFSSLNLPVPLLRALDDCGFEFCTAIQALALPPLLQGGDIAGQAQTGTGKTAAFLLAAYAHLDKHPAASARRATQPRALIVAPTRELAIQIHKDAEQLGKYTDLKQGLVYGGTAYGQQREMLAAGVDVLIGTPGRLIDYFKQGLFNLKALQVVILDEADRMFDLGFIADIRYLFRRMPSPDQRLNMLFSATLSHRVLELAYEHMNNPQRLVVEADRITADRVRQCLYHPASEEKIPLLIGLLHTLQAPRSMVFVNTRRSADKITAYLLGNGFKAAALSGDVPQRQRQRLLEAFQDGALPILVATDVAARGLHVPGVTHVFNYDLPQQAEDYVHRIGRTARVGKSGDAISFACEEYSFSLPEIEEYINHSIDVGDITDELLVAPAKPLFTGRGRQRRTTGKHDTKTSGDRRGQNGDRKRPRSRRGRAGGANPAVVGNAS